MSRALSDDSRFRNPPGSYEVLDPLGAGGMGEVYRARDPRIGRDVAVKVLPAQVPRDVDRRGVSNWKYVPREPSTTPTSRPR